MCSRASRLGELALRLEQSLLEGADPLRRVLEAAAEDDDLLLQRLQLALEFGDLPLVLGEPSLPVLRHAVTSSAPVSALLADTTRGILECPRMLSWVSVAFLPVVDHLWLLIYPVPA